MAKGKGSSFERDICKQLDSWWTGNDLDAVFWRSTQSGGRATTRAAKGQNTHGSHGDIAAIHPSGEPLIDAFTIELKRGYTKHHTAELFDLSDYHREKQHPKQFERFLLQARMSCELAGSVSWMLIHKRDGRQVMCYFPYWIFQFLKKHSSFGTTPIPLMRLKVKLKGDQVIDIAGMRFSSFMEGTTKEAIEILSRS